MPVGPEEGNPAAKFAVVAEFPSPDASRMLQPLSGNGGLLLDRFMRENMRLDRSGATYHYAIACPPYKYKMGFTTSRMNKENRKRKKLGIPPLLHPIEACRPRLLAELERVSARMKRRFSEITDTNILAAGKHSLMAVLPGHRGGIADKRGRPIHRVRTGPTVYNTRELYHQVEDPATLRESLVRIMPTFSPAAVHKQRKLGLQFNVDLRRAVRHFTDTLEWTEPAMNLHPSVQETCEFLGVKWTGKGAEGDPGGFPPRGPGWAHGFEAVEQRPFYAADLETDGIEPLDCNVRCLGIGNRDEAICIPFLSIDGHTRFYASQTEAMLRAICFAYLTGTASWKCGWNSGYYDALVWEQWLGGTGGIWVNDAKSRLSPFYREGMGVYVPDWSWFKLNNHLDGILLHRALYGEYRHSLGEVTSWFSDSRDWKGNHTATDAKTDNELHVYCVYDDKNTVECVEPLAKQVAHAGHKVMVERDHRMQDYCRDMHRVGILIDQEERGRLERHHVGEREAAKAICIEIAHHVAHGRTWSKTGFNPRSTQQVAKLLYEHFGLEVLFTSKLTGMPSVGDAALRRLLVNVFKDAKYLKHPARIFIRALRKFRQHDKIVGTYLNPYRWNPGLAADPGAFILDPHAIDPFDEYEDEWWDLPEKFRKKLMKRNNLRFDGRVHPDWKAHVVVMARLATSPNVQNIPGGLKTMFVPATIEWLDRFAPLRFISSGVSPVGRSSHRERHVFVGADSDQIELRIAVARWGAKKFLEALSKGMDPHQITMEAMFGEDLMVQWLTEGEGCDPSRLYYKDAFAPKSFFEEQRRASKTLGYCAQYGAKTPTVYDTMMKAENRKTGQLLFEHLTYQDIERLHLQWKRGLPEFTRGWKSEQRLYQQQGFVQEPIHGRIRYMADGADPNVIINTPIQGAATSIMNDCALDMVDRGYTAECFGPYTGPVRQCHDELAYEVPESKVEQTMKDLNEAMCKTYPDVFPGMRFTGKASSGLHLGI